jgi:hypothetical protein
MRWVVLSESGVRGVAVEVDGQLRGLLESDPGYPGDLDTLIRQGGAALADAGAIVAKKRAF